MSEVNTPKPIKVLKTNVKPEEIATQYLKHEFIKLFPNQQDSFYKVLDQQIDQFPQTLGAGGFWQFVSGISEGFKLKWTYRILTDSRYSWSLESVKLGDITMTGMSPQMDLILKAAGWNPLKFPAVWQAHPEHKKFEEQGIKPQPERDRLPIMLREKNYQLKVFDGMRRTCVAALQGKQEMVAWVGRITNPKGHMMINPDKALFLRALYDEAPRKDPKLLEAIKKVMRAYVRYYRNGREAVDGALYKWKQDPQLSKVVKEILKTK